MGSSHNSISGALSLVALSKNPKDQIDWRMPGLVRGIEKQVRIVQELVAFRRRNMKVLRGTEKVLGYLVAIHVNLLEIFAPAVTPLGSKSPVKSCLLYTSPSPRD